MEFACRSGGLLAPFSSALVSAFSSRRTLSGCTVCVVYLVWSLPARSCGVWQMLPAMLLAVSP